MKSGDGNSRVCVACSATTYEYYSLSEYDPGPNNDEFKIRTWRGAGCKVFKKPNEHVDGSNRRDVDCGPGAR